MSALVSIILNSYCCCDLYFTLLCLKTSEKIHESVQQTRNIWVSALISLILNSLCCCDLHIFVILSFAERLHHHLKQGLKCQFHIILLEFHFEWIQARKICCAMQQFHQLFIKFSYSAINSSEKSKNSTKQKRKCSGIRFLSLLLAFSMLVVGRWCDRC